MNWQCIHSNDENIEFIDFVRLKISKTQPALQTDVIIYHRRHTRKNINSNTHKIEQ